MTIYEVHLASWRRAPSEGNRPLSYRELADQLADYVADLGFTHVELLPVMEHPFAGSWGYETTGYYAPTARHGTPDDFRFLVDRLHQRGVGVILDWVPAHFPNDAFSLGRFDGTALYEHADSRQGYHPEWHTYIVNYGRNEVRSFLLGSAHYWLEEFHADGLLVDAVSSMLYLDYGRRADQWIPNIHGGNEDLDAIAFLREMNQQIYALHPGVAMIAEEPKIRAVVSRKGEFGGLGFGFKWDMGWMHDTARVLQQGTCSSPLSSSRLDLRFSLFVVRELRAAPLAMKSCTGSEPYSTKCPVTDGRSLPTCDHCSATCGRLGKKILFMGGEFGQWREWNHDESLDWHLLAEPDHRGL